MRYSFFILVLLVCSCKKESTKTVTIRGNVHDIGSLTPAENIKVVLSRSNSFNNDGRSGGDVAQIYTNSNGEFVLTTEISDNFSYTLKVDDPEDEYWLNKEKWGISSQREMEYNSIYTNHEFTIAKKTELKLSITYPQSLDTNDRLIVKLFKPDGELYRTSYFSHSLPNEIELDLSNLSYFHVDLIAGIQHLECVYTNQGVDTNVILNYNLIPNQINEIDLNLQ